MCPTEWAGCSAGSARGGDIQEHHVEDEETHVEDKEKVRVKVAQENVLVDKHESRALHETLEMRKGQIVAKRKMQADRRKDVDGGTNRCGEDRRAERGNGVLAGVDVYAAGGAEFGEDLDTSGDVDAGEYREG